MVQMTPEEVGSMSDQDDFASDWRLLDSSTRGGSGKYIEITGMRYGMLTVIKRAGTDKSGSALWLCKCDCTNEKIVSRANLRKGRVRSCGCLMRKHQKASKKKRFFFDGT